MGLRLQKYRYRLQALCLDVSQLRAEVVLSWWEVAVSGCFADVGARRFRSFAVCSGLPLAFLTILGHFQPPSRGDVFFNKKKAYNVGFPTATSYSQIRTRSAFSRAPSFSLWAPSLIARRRSWEGRSRSVSTSERLRMGVALSN